MSIDFASFLKINYEGFKPYNYDDILKITTIDMVNYDDNLNMTIVMVNGNLAIFMYVVYETTTNFGHFNWYF